LGFSGVDWDKNTNLTETEALKDAAIKIGVLPQSIHDFSKLAHLSPMGVVRGHCSLIDIPEAHFNVWWMRDQFLSDMSSLNEFFDYAIKNNKVEDVLSEKKASVDIWREIEELSAKIRMKDPEDAKYIRVSASYGRIKYEIIEKAFTVVLLGYLGDKTGKYDTQRMKKALAQYDKLWEEWKQLKKKW